MSDDGPGGLVAPDPSNLQTGSGTGFADGTNALAFADTAGLIPVSDGAGGFTWTTVAAAVAAGVVLGGDLSGSLADAVVIGIRGVTVSATAPLATQVLTATSGTAADWAAP